MHSQCKVVPGHYSELLTSMYVHTVYSVHVIVCVCMSGYHRFTWQLTLFMISVAYNNMIISKKI